MIGASAGGVEAVMKLLPGLPADLPAAIAIVIHRLPIEDEPRLARVLGKSAAFPVSEARHKEALRPAHAYVAPPAFHLEIADDSLRLHAGPTENGSRPAIDVLFRSAAESRGRTLVGVLLSGLLDDGTAGLAAVKAAGGFAIVQEPTDALFGEMPQHALDSVAVDVVCPVAEIPAQIMRALEQAPLTIGVSQEETKDAPSPFSCPDCAGVLWEIEKNGLLRYRCRTGHAYTPEALAAHQDAAVERAMWEAVRALEERADMHDTLARRLRRGKNIATASRLERRAAEGRNRAAIILAAVYDLVAAGHANEESHEAGAGG